MPAKGWGETRMLGCQQRYRCPIQRLFIYEPEHEHLSALNVAIAQGWTIFSEVASKQHSSRVQQCVVHAKKSRAGKFVTAQKHLDRFCTSEQANLSMIFGDHAILIAQLLYRVRDILPVCLVYSRSAPPNKL